MDHCSVKCNLASLDVMHSFTSHVVPLALCIGLYNACDMMPLLVVKTTFAHIKEMEQRLASKNVK